MDECSIRFVREGLCGGLSLLVEVYRLNRWFTHLALDVRTCTDIECVEFQVYAKLSEEGCRVAVKSMRVAAGRPRKVPLEGEFYCMSAPETRSR